MYICREIENQVVHMHVYMQRNRDRGSLSLCIYTYVCLSAYIHTNTTDGGDRTSDYYDCQDFQQVFTGVPARITHNFSGDPKISNGFSHEKTESPPLKRVSRKPGKIWRSQYLKSETPPWAVYNEIIRHIVRIGMRHAARVSGRVYRMNV